MRARGLAVDTDGFNAAMERQRAEARRAWAGSGEAATETIWYGLRERVGATEFLGYETETAEGVVRAIVKDGVEVEDARRGRARIADPQPDAVLRRVRRPGRRRRRDSPRPAFAPTSTDTRKTLGDLIVHDVTIVDGSGARRAWRSSLTSITPRALRRAPTIPRPTFCTRPCGSCSAITSRRRARSSRPSGCVSTFAHPKPITRDELEAVEDIANRVVLENAEVTTRLMGLDDARASRRARAVRREIRRRSPRRQHGRNRGRPPTHERTYSIELCGGTHVEPHRRHRPHHHRRRKRGRGGVRRIEAKTRDEARKRLEADSPMLTPGSRGLLRAPAGEATERLEALIDDKRKLERELADAKRKLAMGGGEPTRNRCRARRRRRQILRPRCSPVST